MSSSPIRIVPLGPRDLCHPWEGDPYVLAPKLGAGFWTSQLKVDPFPSYAHDVDLVRREANRMVRLFPMKVPVQVLVLAYEGRDRVNGHCTPEHDYRGEKPYPWGARIVLWGKRIPPHPAMTRYLIPHEYGHAAEKFIERKLGQDDGKLRKEYAKLRRMRNPKYYGGLTWHRSAGELFANDFRILVAEAEPEFWPHPGFERPERVKAVRDFWKEHAA